MSDNPRPWIVGSRLQNRKFSAVLFWNSVHFCLANNNINIAVGVLRKPNSKGVVSVDIRIPKAKIRVNDSHVSSFVHCILGNKKRTYEIVYGVCQSVI